MARNFREDGAPDGRGHSEGSQANWFGRDDGRKRPGRPKGSKNLKSIYLAAAQMPISLTDATGKKRKISTIEGIVLKQRDLALKGAERVMDKFINRVEMYNPVEVDPDRTDKLMAEDAELLAAARGRLMPLVERDGGNSDVE